MSSRSVWQAVPRGQALIRPDSRGTTAVDGTLGPVPGAVDDGGDVDHARAADPDDPAEHAAQAPRDHLSPLRGSDAALLQQPRLASARKDRRAAAGPPDERH